MVSPHLNVNNTKFIDIFYYSTNINESLEILIYKLRILICGISIFEKNDSPYIMNFSFLTVVLKKNEIVDLNVERA
jgi:hypothetical protein